MFVCCPPVTPDSQYVVIQMFILIHPRHTSATLLQVHSGSLLQLQKEKVQPNLLRGTIYSKPPHIQSWNMIYIYILLIASSNLKCSLSSKNYSFGLIVGSSLKCSLTSLISLILMLVTTTTCIIDKFFTSSCLYKSCWQLLLPHALYIHCHVIVHILCLVVFNNLSDLIGIILIPLQKNNTILL